MLENTERLINYLRNITVGLSLPLPHIVADEDQGTVVLNSPRYDGVQVIVALPRANLAGNCDDVGGTHTFIIFCIEKGKQQSETQETLLSQYSKTLGLLNSILDKIARDTCGDGSGDGCSLLAGKDFREIALVPEAGIFGGWNGWSATITLK